jgi:hypothetical protein
MYLPFHAKGRRGARHHDFDRMPERHQLQAAFIDLEPEPIDEFRWQNPAGKIRIPYSDAGNSRLHG